MRILLIFTFAFGVCFIVATPVVFPDDDTYGYFAVEPVIYNPDSLPVADLLAEASENEESVSDGEPAPRHDDLSILAPIAFILKPTTENSKPAPVKPVKSSSSEESSEKTEKSSLTSTELSSPSSSTDASLGSTSSPLLTSSAKPSTKAPCKVKEGESNEEPCKEVQKPVITEDEEEDLKEKAAEVEAEPVILTPSVKK